MVDFVLDSKITTKANGLAEYIEQDVTSDIQGVSIPDYPSGDGEYRLNANVASGVTTLTWVAAPSP